MSLTPSQVPEPTAPALPRQPVSRVASREGLLNVRSTGSSGVLQQPSQALWLNINFATEITLQKRLGQGAFGTVYSALWKHQRVAVKLVPLMLDASSYCSKSLDSLKQEIQVLSRLRHPNIVAFYGACLAPPNVCIVEELAVGGSLHSHLYDNRSPQFQTAVTVLQLGLDVASALEYLHPTIVHRDLKPQNVLLDGDGRFLVCDFGVAKFKDGTFLSTKNVHAGTPAYMAPEQFEGRPINEKVDLYAFAMLMAECLLGEPPWKELEHPMQIIFVVGVQGQRPALPPATPPAMAALITQCWDESPEKRPGFTEVLARLQAEASRCNGSTQNATQGQASTPVATSNNGPGSSTPTRSSSAANISSAVSSSVGRRETPRPPTRRASFSALTTSLLGRLPSAQEAPPYEIAAGLHSGTCSAVTPESLRTMQGPSSLGTTPSSLDTHQAPCSADAAHPGSTVQDHMPHPHGLSPCGHTTTTASVQENATLLPPQPNSVSAHLHLHPPGTGVLSGELSSAAPMQAASQAQPTHTSSVGFPPSLEPRHLCQRGWW
ncbi:MAG: hypothetical protein WDW38_002418 [Sanguina aurantia]